MNIASKKSNFIDWFNQLNDLKIINRLDKFRIAVNENKMPAIVAFEELLDDLEISERQRIQNKFMDITEVEKKSAKW